MLARPSLWIRALRAPFFQAVVVPALLGTALAWHRARAFHPWLLLLTLAGVVSLQAGAHLANDYFDHVSGADQINEGPTSFSGGGRVIQQGLVSPQAIYRASMVLFVAYLVLVLGASIRIIPLPGLLCLLTAPLAWRAAKEAGANFRHPKGLVWAMADTVKLHLAFGLLLSFGYMLAGMCR